MGETDRDALPLPDYDHLPTGSLASRIRALSADEVKALLAHEREHGDRAPVARVLEARLTELAEGAEPSGGDPAAARPEARQHGAGSAVSPATAAEPVHPPPHGTPDQPGRPKGNQP